MGVVKPLVLLGRSPAADLAELDTARRCWRLRSPSSFPADDRDAALIADDEKPVSQILEKMERGFDSWKQFKLLKVDQVMRVPIQGAVSIEKNSFAIRLRFRGQ
jgi:phenylalanyl-tRNA synthetase beta subunit